MRKLMLILTCAILASWQLMAQLPVFPAPAHVRYATGTFTAAKNLIPTGTGEYAGKAADHLKNELQKLEIPARSEGKILLELNLHSTFGKEGYELTVTPEEVRMVASTEAGLFYAR